MTKHLLSCCLLLLLLATSAALSGQDAPEPERVLIAGKDSSWYFVERTINDNTVTVDSVAFSGPAAAREYLTQRRAANWHEFNRITRNLILERLYAQDREWERLYGRLGTDMDSTLTVQLANDLLPDEVQMRIPKSDLTDTDLGKLGYTVRADAPETVATPAHLWTTARGGLVLRATGTTLGWPVVALPGQGFELRGFLSGPIEFIDITEVRGGRGGGSGGKTYIDRRASGGLGRFATVRTR